jgi:A/G-specific adenine glycosylase
VLVSEVMAQQTQLARVVPAYLRFMEQFPTPASCAAASTGDVLRAWHGLGYNRRARNLHRASQAVVAEHGGRLPSDLSGLLSLPGVGAYTARAVLAFAYEVDVGVVDTNAGRVLSRAVAGRPVSSAEAQRLVDAMVPPTRGWWFGQALLDLGAGTCVAGTPRCGECPIRRRCRWAATGRCGADPAAGSAGVSVAQSRFDGSDRQGRGRLVGWEGDPERVDRVVAGLTAEGMVVRTPDGSLRLP